MHVVPCCWLSTQPNLFMRCWTSAVCRCVFGLTRKSSALFLLFFCLCVLVYYALGFSLVTPVHEPNIPNPSKHPQLKSSGLAARGGGSLAACQGCRSATSPMISASTMAERLLMKAHTPHGRFLPTASHLYSMPCSRCSMEL